MSAYFRGVLGQPAHLNCVFQQAVVAIDEVQPAVKETIRFLRSWYLQDSSAGSPRVQKVEKALAACESHYEGDSPLALEVFPFPADSIDNVYANLNANAVLQRGLMVQHAKQVVESLEARFPDLSLVDCFKIFAPSFYKNVHKLYTDNQLTTHGAEELGILRSCPLWRREVL
ncbi:hypothetical protein CYMTET_23940 [Cymbomonas tetramitiformis]|uniref:Uncharacterized protein n=1 Tax=Cymbomonas tetramitiformis TaxID=36881 RepID=A0AAE0FXP8_9CHLO|nr:hypothetical protein CYMTET_23940 [Cymbomonas tetramitiformis]